MCQTVAVVAELQYCRGTTEVGDYFKLEFKRCIAIRRNTSCGIKKVGNKKNVTYSG